MSNSTKNTPATVVNSDYKWLTQSLKTAQLGPAYTPYFKMKALDDSLSPNQIVYGQLLNGLVSAYNLDGNSNDSAGSNNGTDTGIQYVAGKIGQAAQFSGISTSGLVSYYKLDANSNDSVGSNNGTDTAISYANPGIIGNCATFNGSSYIDIPYNINLDPTLVSVSAWIKTSATTRQIIFRNGYGGSTKGYQLYVEETTGTLGFYAYHTVSSKLITSTNPVNDGNWHHVVGLYDGTNISIYIDGVSAQTPVAFSGFLYDSSVDCYIGNDSAITNYPFIGSIDELAIFSRALSASEISSLYNSGVGRALQYFGSNIQKASPVGMPFSGSCSFATWMYLPALALNTMAIQISSNSSNNFYLYACDSNGHASFGFEDTVGGFHTVVGSTTLPTNVWFQIIGVFDAVAQTITLYYNGSQIAQTTGVTQTPYTGGTQTLYLGCDNGINRLMYGLLDMTYIYNRALTAGEVANLYNAGKWEYPVHISS